MQPQKRRGPPATGKGMPIQVRMQPAELAALDAWISKQTETPSRPEAIRRLVALGLTVKTKSAPSERQRAALADLASKAIDSVTVSKPNNGEKASRKRRLIKWHEEIPEARVDLPKAKAKK